MSAPSDLAQPHIPALHAYTPGLQPTDSGWVKLNTNECPYPPSPKVAQAIEAELTHGGDRLRLYPNPTSAPLRQLVADIHGLGNDQVLVGNGSDDILNLLVRVFGGPHIPTAVTLPSYSLYPVLIAIQNGAARHIAFDRSMRLPIEDTANSSANAVFLTSPNAPTGVAFSPDEIESLLNRFPGMLVVDEAYAPFAKNNCVALLARHPRLVITRTLSKAHALAGLRVGYALAHPETIGLLDRVRDSYNVNRLSQAGAFAALSDPAYYDGVITKIRRTRDHWLAAWRARGWFTYDSETNFIFTEPRDRTGKTGPDVAKSLYDFLVSKKILVRHFPNHALTAPFLRISVGTDDEMLAVENAIHAWLAQ